eukprot:jgi/Hompol1/6465/HPOL_003552-RA
MTQLKRKAAGSAETATKTANQPGSSATVKKSTASASASASASAAKKAKSGDDESGEEALSLEIAPLRRLTVSKWKGKVLIGIREYYKDKATNEDKPGKKGISISADAWESIKNNFAEIDAAIAKLG